jgi:outer membrane protein assembly factor BamB
MSYGFSILPPTAPTLRLGFLPGKLNGLYKYALTYVSSFGETVLGEIACITTYKTSSVEITFEKPNNVNSINIYRSYEQQDFLLLHQFHKFDSNSNLFLYTDVGLTAANISPPKQHSANSKISFNGDIEFNDNVIFTGKTSFNAPTEVKSRINSNNISTIYGTDIIITSDFCSTIKSASAPISDGVYTYMVTQGILSTVEKTDGYVLCCNENKIIWKRLMSSYSKIPGDFANNIVLCNNYLIFGSALNIPQTYYPYIDMVKRYTGEKVFASGKPPCLYCVDKLTGILIWESTVGKIAHNITDAGNFEYVSSILVDEKSEIPLVICGMASSQGKHPWLVCPNGKTFGPSLGTLWSFRFTDVGRLLFVNLHTGEIIHEKYTIKNISSENPYIYYYAADLYKEGFFNTLESPFNSSLTCILHLGESFPSMLKEGYYIDNNGEYSILNVVNDNFDKVVICVDVIFSQGIISYNGCDYDITSQCLEKCRITIPKNLINIYDQKLYDQKLYECSYFGAGIVGMTFGEYNKKPAIYVTTGPNEKVPYYDSSDKISYINILKSIKMLQKEYKKSPTILNLALLTAEYSKLDNIPDPITVHNLNYANSVLCILLEDFTLFAYKLIPHNVIHYGYYIDAMRYDENNNKITGISSTELYYGDYGQESVLQNPIYYADNELFIPAHGKVFKLNCENKSIECYRIGNPCADGIDHIYADGILYCLQVNNNLFEQLDWFSLKTSACMKYKNSYVIALKNGEILWEYNIYNTATELKIVNDVLLIVDKDGNMHCCHAKTGKLINKISGVSAVAPINGKIYALYGADKKYKYLRNY